MSLKIEKPARFSLWKALVAVLVVAGGLILWTRLAPRPSTPLSFEIAGFEGDAKIYDLKTHAWRLPKRGEEFNASQKLKTGADGIINFQVANEILLRLKENSELQNEESRMSGKRAVYKLRLAKGVLLGVTTRQFDRKQKADQAVLNILARDYVAVVHGAVFRVQAAAQSGQENKVGVLRGFVEVSKPAPFFRSEGVRIRGLEQTSMVQGAIQPVTKVSSEEWGLMKESYELLEKTAVMEAEQIDLSKQAGTFFERVFDHGTFFTPKVGYAGREFFKDPDSGQVLLETEYDVFPAGSFCGVYIKTRDFDISKYTGLSFDVRRNSEEGAPDSLFIELKSKGNVIRRYAPRNFERNWKRVEFDFRAQKASPVNEVVLVFTNARVGEAKKGVLEFRNINLIPLSAAPATVSKVEAGAAKVAPSKPATPKPVAPAAASVSTSEVKAAAASPAESATRQLAEPSVPKEVPLQ